LWPYQNNQKEKFQHVGICDIQLTNIVNNLITELNQYKTGKHIRIIEVSSDHKQYKIIKQDSP
jgi:hypothetical protein